MHQAHFKITGLVQGVSYRFYAKEKAAALGLKGFIRNTDDGSVEVVLQGEKESLAAFRLWAYDGSPSSKVDGVKMVMPPPDEPYFESLKIS